MGLGTDQSKDKAEQASKIGYVQERTLPKSIRGKDDATEAWPKCNVSSEEETQQMQRRFL